MVTTNFFGSAFVVQRADSRFLSQLGVFYPDDPLCPHRLGSGERVINSANHTGKRRTDVTTTTTTTTPRT